MAHSTQSANLRKSVKQNRTKPKKRIKPSVPDGSPLFAHASGRFAKKIRGRFVYFGSWDEGHQAALDRWLDQKDALLAGRVPRFTKDQFTLEDLCDAFMAYNESKVSAGAIRQRTWDEYYDVCETMLKTWGKHRLVEDLEPEDFHKLRQRIAKGLRPKTIHSRIGRCRVVLNFAYKNALIDKPIRWGIAFERPTKKTIREDQAAQDHLGVVMLERKQIRDVLKIASLQIKAMILLAVNTGMGNEDCGKLEFRHVDLEAGWLDYPRPKTSVRRRARLWPETIKAIRETIQDRREPLNPANEDFIFITRYGMTWHKATRENPISREFRNLLTTAGHYKKGIGFYALRRTFETIAAETLDQPAIDLSMGHEGNEMSALYRQRLGDDRLFKVAKHVRHWLFGDVRKK